jgi:hypothetical protein
MRCRLAVGILLLLSCTVAHAQECDRVDAETCMNGAIYRCTQTGGVKGWILRAPYEKCEVRTESIRVADGLGADIRRRSVLQVLPIMRS